MQFSRTAAYYHLLEDCCIGSALRHTRLGCLDQLGPADSLGAVLIVGEGNGVFLRAFAQRYPQAPITVIDESAKMLERAQKRLLRAGVGLQRIEFRVADIRAVSLPANHYHLIVTHCFFTNFATPDVQQMVGQLAAAAQVRGALVAG